MLPVQLAGHIGVPMDNIVRHAWVLCQVVQLRWRHCVVRHHCWGALDVIHSGRDVAHQWRAGTAVGLAPTDPA